MQKKSKRVAIPEIEEVDEEQIEYAAKKLMDEIVSFRKEISCSPIKCEPLYLTEAAELCTVGVTGHMVSNLLTLQELGDKKEQLDFFDKHWMKVLLICGILMIPLIYYMVINK